MARLAGQYAKPRSAQTETLSDGSKIPSYRGDMINGLEHSERVPSASRLVDAYFHAAATGSYVRTLLSSGFSSLPRGSEPPWAVNLKHVRDQQLQDEYQVRVPRRINPSAHTVADIIRTEHRVAHGRELSLYGRRLGISASA